MNKTDIIIIGAGPVGLFTVFEAGLLGLNCTIIDNLDKPGGQCAELYPEKPIYDIPGVPFQTGQEHVNALLEQIKPFDYELHLSERVDSIENITYEDDTFWKIFGGGDSALDWTVELSKIAKSVSLVHRRDAFRGAQHTEELMRNLVKDNKVNLLTPYLIDSIVGNKKVESITLKNFETSEIESYEADELIFLFGLNKKLGPILDWNIELNGKKIQVNTENFQTSKEGIFAVGDINDYPGKLDLILSGFHETTLAVQEAYKRIYPGERVPFGYTTSNSKLQEKLGVKK